MYFGRVCARRLRRAARISQKGSTLPFAAPGPQTHLGRTLVGRVRLGGAREGEGVVGDDGAGARGHVRRVAHRPRPLLLLLVRLPLLLAARLLQGAGRGRSVVPLLLLVLLLETNTATVTLRRQWERVAGATPTSLSESVGGTGWAGERRGAAIGRSGWPTRATREIRLAFVASSPPGWREKA